MAVTPSVLKLQTSRDNIQKANDQENTIGRAELEIVREPYLLRAEIVTLGFANGKTGRTHPRNISLLR